ncbi:MAG: sulfotransferase domain-containing protein [Alteraurantiacibacter sp.]
MIDWLASYPKSGNTWMRMLLANYYREDDQPHDINAPGVTNGIASSRMRFDELLCLDSTIMTDDEVAQLQPHVFDVLLQLSPVRQWMKVHDAQVHRADGTWLLPPQFSGSVVYLIRNPLDVAVSRAFHDGHGDMDKAIAMLCAARATIGGGGKTQLRQTLGDWSHHVTSWVDQDAIPVTVVRYEDMLADTAGELARVIAFARPDEVIDEARLEQAVANAAFDKLQAAEADKGFREVGSRQDRFFRSGTAGDWVNHLSAEQVDRIIEAHGPTMARFGYSA